MSATITERVAAGAAFLDEHDPEWWRADVDRAIDLGTLNLCRTDLCVLGQRCPLETLAGWSQTPVDELTGDDDIDRYYAFGQALMRAEDDPRHLFEWAREHGFTAGADQWDDMTAEWRKVIEARRSA